MSSDRWDGRLKCRDGRRVREEGGLKAAEELLPEAAAARRLDDTYPNQYPRWKFVSPVECLHSTNKSFAFARAAQTASLRYSSTFPQSVSTANERRRQPRAITLHFGLLSGVAGGHVLRAFSFSATRTVVHCTKDRVRRIHHP